MRITKKLLGVFFIATIGNISVQDNTYTIRGVVCDSLSNNTLYGVYITDGKRGGQTNINGEYEIKNIPAGKVKLSSMYYSSYPTVNHEFILTCDTTINFVLKETALNMDEVVVTGTRTEKRLSDTPVLTTLISDREIRKAGSVSTLETLQDNVPGVVFSPNAMGNNMRIKGLNSRYILMLVDGERLVSEGAGGNINLDQIDVNNIERIEMINGAASALYGSNAVGAVINIITKKPTHKIEGGANIIAESNNTWKYKFDVGSKLDKTSMRASAFMNSSDGFGGDGEGAYSAKYEDMGVNLNLGYKLSSTSDINIYSRYFRHETFNPANSMNVSHALTHNMAVGANVGRVSANGKNTMRLSINWDKYLDYNVMELKNNSTEKQNSADFVSVRFVDTYRAADKLETVGGLEYNHEQIYAVKTLGIEPTTKSVDDASIFAQAEWEIFRNFDLVAGARYTYNEQFSSAFTPKVSIMYETGIFKFRAGTGSAFRAPTIKELYYDFDHQGAFWVYGNPNLLAEKGLYNSLSVEITKGLFNASLSAYYNNIDNKITQYDVINSIGGMEKYYKNVSSATLKGIDFNMSVVLLRELVFKGSYSYCDAKDNATGLQLASNVKHSGTMSLTWNGWIHKSPFSLQVSGRLNSPILTQEVVTEDGEQSISISQSKSYSIWKAVFVKPFRLNKHTVDLTLKCDNIFEFKDTAYINPGRQYLVGLRYSFK